MLPHTYLVAFLLCKADDLVFDGGAVARALGVHPAAVDGRFGQVLPYQAVRLSSGVRQIAGHLDQGAEDGTLDMGESRRNKTRRADNRWTDRLISVTRYQDMQGNYQLCNQGAVHVPCIFPPAVAGRGLLYRS